MKQNNIWTKPITHILILLLSAICGYFCKNIITDADITRFVDTIKTQSATVFAVFGIWLGLIYPKVFEAISKLDYKELKHQKADNVTIPLLIGALFLIFSLIFDLFIPVIKLIPASELKSYVYGFCFSFIVLSYLELIIAFILSIIPILKLKMSLDIAKDISSSESDKFSQTIK